MSIWQNAWSASKQSPPHHTILRLIALNGLSLSQIIQLTGHSIDITNRWIYLPDGSVYPMVTPVAHALEAILQQDNTPLFTSEDLTSFSAEYEISESHAHQRLAGAIWVTSRESTLIDEFTQSESTDPLPIEFTFPFSIVYRLNPEEEPEIALRSQVVLEQASQWLMEEVFESKPPQSLRARLFDGKTIFVLISTGVSGLNLLHNLLMGRMLTPAEYGQLTLIITLQLLVGILPSTLQTASARFSAMYAIQHQYSFIREFRSFINRFAWIIGIGLTIGMLLFRNIFVDIFQLQDISLILPVAIAWSFLIVMGTDRGVLQGMDGFYWLSASYLVEALIRIIAGVVLGYALINAGHALDGAVWGITQAIFVTWFIGWLAIRHYPDLTPAQKAPTLTQRFTIFIMIPFMALAGGVQQGSPKRKPGPSQELRSEWKIFIFWTGVALLGQTFITNSDFLLVKTFFDATEAGQYAAVSVLGRIAYFGAVPLTMVMIPIIAKQKALGEPTRRYLWMMLGAGGAICSGLLVTAILFAPQIIGAMYGQEYIGGAGLLPIYTIAASLFVLTNLTIMYQIALGDSQETWLLLVAGVVQVVAVALFHQSLEQVIFIQIALMTVLLTIVLWRVNRNHF